jgi:hypothetical protein
LRSPVDPRFGTVAAKSMNVEIAFPGKSVRYGFRRWWVRVWHGAASEETRLLGFRPAFLDRRTGRVCPSCFGNGMPAPVHVLDGLPEDWIVERDPGGRPSAAKRWVVAGFIRDGRFYTRRQAARALSVLSLEQAARL